MAWYLLGREYAARGEAGKAAYCFAQSGEIYEAFEKQKIVVDGPLPPFAPQAGGAAGDASAGAARSGGAGASAARSGSANAARGAGIGAGAGAARSGGAGAAADPAGERRAARRRRLRWALRLALALLMLLPTSLDVARPQQREDRAAEAVPTAADAGATASPTPAPIATPPPPKDGRAVVFADGDLAQAIPELLTPGEAAWKTAVLVEAQPTSDGKWLAWNKPLQPLLSVEYASAQSSTAQLSYYKSTLCSCQAGDPTPLVPLISEWSRQREEALVMMSALMAYQQRHGALPNAPEQLVQPYPDNELPGLTEGTRAYFPQALAELQQVVVAGGQPADGAAAPSAAPSPQASPAPGAQPAAAKAAAYPFTQPLEIIVDVDAHRLALVSGKFVIRSYPVGLGGAKTPLGEFVISEKVRNPNGHSNGEFGSRGMTLSDTLYAIHGTNKPSSIGKDESHGCIRMLQADVEELYDMAPQGTKVTIGKGTLAGAPGSGGSGAGEGDGGGSGAGGSQPGKPFQAPLQTEDSNPHKTYKWLD
ncbi:L,D-transpeptidase [Paenibacillus athensensis]|nr:L,D-transpeptidase [Paenibacillus athensensis]